MAVLGGFLPSSSHAGGLYIPDPIRPLCSMLVVDQGGPREQLEAALQQGRYAATVDEESLSEILIYHWMELELMRYLSLRTTDSQIAEEIFHDTYLEVSRFLRRQRARDAPPRPYLPLVYIIAKQRLYAAGKETAPVPFGDMRWVADTQGPQYGLHQALAVGEVQLYTPPFASMEDYSELSTPPIPLSARQLAVIRGLSTGESHGEIAQKLQVDIRQVHDAIGGVETKVQEALQNPGIRRSHLSYLPDMSANNRVFILSSFNGKKDTLLAEGPIPFEKDEIQIIGGWVKGESLETTVRRLDLDSLEARRTYLRLLYERRRDYDELYAGKKQLFVKTFQVTLGPAEGEYALLRAFGLERPEIIEALNIPASTLIGRVDRIRMKLAAALSAETADISLLRPYYCLIGDNRERVQAILGDSQGRSYLVEITIEADGNRGRRQKQREKVVASRSEVAKQISFMDQAVRKVMAMRVLEGQSTPMIAQTLNVGIDTVRKRMAVGSFSLGLALQQPELNLFNLELTDR